MNWWTLTGAMDKLAEQENTIAQLRAEVAARRARVAEANSVDGVSADDAPMEVDSLCPAAAWVEGVQHGQDMVLAALAAPARPTDTAEGA